MMENETYLGDGLYASFDGFQIILRAPREHGDHYVALEPTVYAALCKFVDSLIQISDEPIV
jgi:hypothetical protein